MSCTEGDYIKRYSDIGLTIDKNTLIKSYRCSNTVCIFITENIGISIYSHDQKETTITFIETQEEADKIFFNDTIVKLFLQEHHKYNCYSQNWGNCKGEDKYYDVCVVLNKNTLNLYNNNSLETLKPLTRNKLYVACSRSKNNLYLVPDKFYKKYKSP